MQRNLTGVFTYISNLARWEHWYLTVVPSFRWKNSQKCGFGGHLEFHGFCDCVHFADKVPSLSPIANTKVHQTISTWRVT